MSGNNLVLYMKVVFIWVCKMSICRVISTYYRLRCNVLWPRKQNWCAHVASSFAMDHSTRPRSSSTSWSNVECCHLFAPMRTIISVEPTQRCLYFILLICTILSSCTIKVVNACLLVNFICFFVRCPNGGFLMWKKLLHYNLSSILHNSSDLNEIVLQPTF